jgi:hypothetical protein
MIQQLVRRWAAANPGIALPDVVGQVLTADPLDLIWHMEQVWHAANLWSPNTVAPGIPLPAPLANPGPAGPARLMLIANNQFINAGPVANLPGAPQAPEWFHLGYAFAIENTRVAQIMARVVRGFRSGESLGIPSYGTQRWLDATEALLFNAGNPVAAWLSTSGVRPDAEAVRRNAYHRLFGMDLAHGADNNAAVAYDRADTANRGFVQLFEELLYELWRAIENVRNIAGANAADDDRIYRLAERIGEMLRSRRQNALLGREELAAVTAMGWLDLTLSVDTPVVNDLRANATSASDRLRFIGQRVGLAPHSRAGAFFAMAEELALLLRALEAGWVTDAAFSWLLYQVPGGPGVPPAGPGVPAPLGIEVRRVITEWSAASGRDLKARPRPVEVAAAANGRVLARR